MYYSRSEIFVTKFSSRFFRYINFAAKVLLFFELSKSLGDFFAYFDRFGFDMRSTAGFEEENDVAAAEEETA